VVIEGQTVLANYDVAASVGFLSADVKEATVTCADGALTITFQHVVENPFVSAIEVLAAAPLLPSEEIASGSGTWNGADGGEAGVLEAAPAPEDDVGCSVSGTPQPLSLLGLAAALMLLWRRRKSTGVGKSFYIGALSAAARTAPAPGWRRT
jgi:MYXO-CTERM domain-containing protein